MEPFGRQKEASFLKKLDCRIAIGGNNPPANRVAEPY